MKCLLKQVNIVAPGAPHHGNTLDILIAENGKIAKIAPEIQASEAKVIAFDNASVSPGFIDIGVHACDPGFEHREDLDSVAAAACAGGFTAIAVLPNTHPSIHTKSEVSYIRNTRHLLTEIHPIGALSNNCEGREITEMMDMHEAGAIAFSDGLHAVQNGGLMMRALQYVKTFDGLIINRGLDESISNNGQINEGHISTSLGMKGIPALAEEMMVQRDIQLTRYTGSRLHIPNISTAGTVELVRKAKAAGLRITSSVAVLNLLYDDTAILDFNTDLKVMPPLRTAVDIQALKDGLKDGTIDFISSNHIPLEEEEKLVEFPYAGFGALGLQTAFSLSLKALAATLDLPGIIEKWTSAPKKIFGLSNALIEVGEPANITVFDPEREWVLTPGDILSKSRNSPFINQSLQGRILAVFNNGRSMMYADK